MCQHSEGGAGKGQEGRLWGGASPGSLWKAQDALSPLGTVQGLTNPVKGEGPGLCHVRAPTESLGTSVSSAQTQGVDYDENGDPKSFL